MDLFDLLSFMTRNKQKRLFSLSGAFCSFGTNEEPKCSTLLRAGMILRDFSSKKCHKTTIMDKIFEKNFSFYLIYYFAAKCQHLVLNQFLLALKKIHFGRKI